MTNMTNMEQLQEPSKIVNVACAVFLILAGGGVGSYFTWNHFRVEGALLAAQANAKSTDELGKDLNGRVFPELQKRIEAKADKPASK